MIMGNETSHLSGLEINEKATEITDFWAHYQATVNDSGYFFNLKGHGSISVFKSEAPVLGPLWTLHSPLEKCAISLMKYRHPSILRYVWHWQQRGVHWLATEPVQPLSQALSTQDSLHICVGLNQILQALEFLHNKASQSHNNVSIGSIYVMADGCWKLGGMEFLRAYSEMNSAYLKETKKHRYDKAVDQNEELSDDLTKIDQYAFCTLVEDVLKGRNEDDVPFLREFKTICRSELQNPVASLRPNLSSLLKHEFFNHEFISIHKFLTSLPLKCEQDKSKFFCGLIDKLRNFKEETVARQLGGPLLSRMVLLDSTAREKLLPYILVPKAEHTAAEKDTGLFSLSVFTQHVTPQLLRMFRVRDVQVRLSLLKHFSGYFATFSREDLTTFVLPELLVGIKDTSDTLVSMTLLCLADLVPILGAATVIGGKRFKLFADGRPLTHPRIKSDSIPHKLKQKIISQTALDKRPDSLKLSHQIKTHDREILSQSRTIAESPPNKFVADETSFGSGESIEIESNLFLHERPSPDGGEDLDSEVMVNTVEEDVDGSDGNWSDWNENENRENVVFESEFDIKGSAITQAHDISDTSDIYDFKNLANIKTALICNDLQGASITNSEIKESVAVKNNKNDSLYLQKAAMDAKSRKLTDISELDIKNQKFKVSNLQNSTANRDEFDFFTDMEPVIEKTSTFLVNEKVEISNELSFDSVKLNENIDFDMPQTISSKLSFAPEENEESKAGDEAWGSGGWEDV